MEMMGTLILSLIPEVVPNILQQENGRICMTSSVIPLPRLYQILIMIYIVIYHHLHYHLTLLNQYIIMH